MSSQDRPSSDLYELHGRRLSSGGALEPSDRASSGTEPLEEACSFRWGGPERARVEAALERLLGGETRPSVQARAAAAQAALAAMGQPGAAPLDPSPIDLCLLLQEALFRELPEDRAALEPFLREIFRLVEQAFRSTSGEAPADADDAAERLLPAEAAQALSKEVEQLEELVEALFLRGRGGR